MSKLAKIFIVIFLAGFYLSAEAAWQCNFYNTATKQRWVGVGPTRQAALDNAIRFCSRYANVRFCQPMGCFQR